LFPAVIRPHGGYPTGTYPQPGGWEMAETPLRGGEPEGQPSRDGSMLHADLSNPGPASSLIPTLVCANAIGRLIGMRTAGGANVQHAAASPPGNLQPRASTRRDARSTPRWSMGFWFGIFKLGQRASLRRLDARNRPQGPSRPKGERGGRTWNSREVRGIRCNAECPRPSPPGVGGVRRRRQRTPPPPQNGRTPHAAVTLRRASVGL
jgi:hypothetical protein